MRSRSLFGSSSMAWISAMWAFAVVVAFSNVPAFPRVFVAPSAAMPLDRIRTRALVRQDFIGRSASILPGNQPSIAARAVMAGAVFALTCGRARRLVAKVRIIPESNEGRSRGQGQGKASLIQKMRNSRRSAEITQLLESIQPKTVQEDSMGISAYGRARD